jgi:uncharacterized lipoprotein YmbA
MNHGTNSCFIISCLAMIMISGCAGRQTYDKHYYLLNAERPARPFAQQKDAIIEVRQFTIDSAFSGKGLVYRTGELEYQSDFYHEFLVSPRSMITEETRNWLADSGLCRTVTEAASLTDPTHVIEANVTALYGDYRKGPKAVLETRVFLLKTQPAEDPAPVFGKTYKSSFPLESAGPQALVEAINKCLISILADLEADLTNKLS